jgi:phosphatidylglycerol:prolipoprotein diacylglycerol transferase
MMMLATICAVGLAAYRAWQVGIDPELIYQLAFVMFIAGIVGARLFFIVQYWHEFRKLAADGTIDWLATGKGLFNVTQGGLVVYGSVLAGLPAGAWFCWRRGLPLLVIADIIAPSMVVGQALGRVGCFLNGCCYGGVCLTSLGVSFPADSPPYKLQLGSGWESGVWVEEQAGRIVVAYLAPGSPAEGSQLRVGDEVEAINGREATSLKSARELLSKSLGGTYAVRTADEQMRWWRVPPLPPLSVPIHATQLYAAIDAGLLAWVLWLAYPFRRRHGEIFAVLVTIHPITRILLEVIRSDEQGFLNSPLTISQWIGLGILAAAAALWIYIARQPRLTETRMTKA